MGRVNIVKQVKVDGKWTLRSIPKKKSGHYDWAALPDGDYFVEWSEDARRRRQPAGNTAAQAMEEQRRKRHELEARALGFAPRNGTSDVAAAAASLKRRAAGDPEAGKDGGRCRIRICDLRCVKAAL